MTLKTLLAAALAASTALAQGLAYPAGLQPGDEYRVLFVTDSTRDATSADISTYDAFVTADAGAVPFLAALNTNWRAVASTPAVSARVHIDADPSVAGVPIYRPDGVRVADDYRNLWGGVVAGQLLAPPNVTASGAVTSASRVWSGTYVNGTPAADPLGSSSGNAWSGAPSLATYSWIWGNNLAQSGLRPLYGISDVLTAPYPDYPRDLKPGDQFRILFVTDSTRDATSSNINDYDDFVIADAQAVPAMRLFGTNWRAVASTPTVAAKVHIDADPGVAGVAIYRPDGVRLANDYRHLWDDTGPGALLALPNVTASGAVTTAGRVWSGTYSTGIRAANPLGSPSGNAEAGGPGFTSYSWIYANTLAQTGLHPLYGISDVITVPEPKHPQDLQPGQRYRVLFLTDGTRDATSSNITDYDDFVSADANAVPAMRLYDTEWRALASTPGVSARFHIDADPSVAGVPIYRPDGTRVANDYGNLWSGVGAGQLLAPPNVTASGGASTLDRVWTGTNIYGLAATGDELGSSTGTAIVGIPDSATYGWISANRISETSLRPLYGISEVLFVPYPDVIGTSCGSASLSRDTLPVLGTSFQCTLSGVPLNGLGAVLVDLGLPTAGTPQPTPPFAAGCMAYLASSLTLGITLQPSRQFAVAIPNDTAYIGLPIAMQGATIDLSSGEVTLTNAIAARVRD